MRPPKFSNEEAVAKFVDEVFDQWQAEDAVEEALREEPPMRASEILASMEREAIEAAEDGNFKPLGSMIKNPLFKHFNGVLSDKARMLLAAKMNDEVKIRRGPKKRSIWQRDLDPKFAAAEEVDKIAHLLKHHYPREKGHVDRAITIAADRAVKWVKSLDPELQRAAVKFDRQTLESYYLKSRHRRRRPT